MVLFLGDRSHTA